jgi:hypothetical protein
VDLLGFAPELLICLLWWCIHMHVLTFLWLWIWRLLSQKMCALDSLLLTNVAFYSFVHIQNRMSFTWLFVVLHVKNVLLLIFNSSLISEWNLNQIYHTCLHNRELLRIKSRTFLHVRYISYAIIISCLKLQKKSYVNVNKHLLVW